MPRSKDWSVFVGIVYYHYVQVNMYIVQLPCTLHACQAHSQANFRYAKASAPACGYPSFSFLDTALSRPVEWNPNIRPLAVSGAPARGMHARIGATPAFSRVGASGMQWAPHDETGGLDAAENRGASTVACCKDIP